MKRIFQGVIEGNTLAKISEELTADRILTPAALFWAFLSGKQE